MTQTPLTWPMGWKRTTERKSARFHRDGAAVTIAEGIRRSRLALERLGCVGTPIISTNLSLKSNGLPYSQQGEPNDPGVAVYWQTQAGQTHKVMAIDRYDRVADNLAAIAATLESMRLIERHGGATILDRAFTGFLALPQPNDWRYVFGCEGETPTLAEVKTIYRRMTKAAHPDLSSRADAHDRMTVLNQAWADAERELSA